MRLFSGTTFVGIIVPCLILLQLSNCQPASTPTTLKIWGSIRVINEMCCITITAALRIVFEVLKEKMGENEHQNWCGGPLVKLESNKVGERIDRNIRSICRFPDVSK